MTDETPTRFQTQAKKIDDELAALVKDENRARARIAELLLEMSENRLYLSLGHQSLGSYALDRFGRSSRWAKDMVELATNMKLLPAFEAAFRAGELRWTKALTGSRGALVEPKNSAQWLEDTKGLSNRELERNLALAKGIELPIRVTIELTREEHAIFEAAIAAARVEHKQGSLSVGAALAEACRRALTGGGELGGPKHRILIVGCDDCGEGSRESPQGSEPIERAVMERVGCNSEIVGPDGKLTRTIPADVLRRIVRRDRGRCRVPGCPSSAWLEAHHDGGWQVVGHDPERMFLACTAHHRALHEGRLLVDHVGSLAQFKLADGEPLGTPVDLAIPKSKRGPQASSAPSEPATPPSPPEVAEPVPVNPS